MPYQFGAGWAAVEQALYDWLHGQTQLTVRFIYPEGTAQVPQPAGDYGEIAVTSWVPAGWAPGRGEQLHPENPPEQEIERVHRRTGSLNITVQLYTKATKGAASAFPRLMEASAVLDLPSVQGPLLAAGLGLVERGGVRNMTGVLGMGSQGRAVLELRFEVRETVSDFVGAATGVRLTNTVT